MKKESTEVKTSAPTLTTILMVEEVLKEKATANPLTVAQLKIELPRQVNHNVLIVILKYLEASNKISFSLDGMTWIAQESRLITSKNNLQNIPKSNSEIISNGGKSTPK